MATKTVVKGKALLYLRVSEKSKTASTSKKKRFYHEILEIALRNCIVWGSIEIRCWNGVRKGE
jgi:hypothetical protein